MKTGKNTTASLLAALLLGAPSAPLWAQAGGAGAGAGTGAAGGTSAGAGAGTGAAGNGTGGAAGTGAGAAGTAAGGVGGSAAGNGTTGNGANGSAAGGNGANGNGANGNGANGTGGAAAGGGTAGNTGGANAAGGNGTSGNGASAAGNNGANGANGAGNNGANGIGGNGAGGGGGANSTGGSGAGSVRTTSSPAPQHYDLARTVADAIAASADVQTAKRNVEIDRKQSDFQAAKGRPNVNAQGQAIRFDQATVIPFAGTPITVTNNHKEILSLNVGEQLDLTGQIRAASDQYRLQSLSDQFVLQQFTNARILRAKNIYFNLLQTYHQVQVAQANLADAEQNLQDTQNQNAAGTGLRLDLLRAQTQVAQDQQQLSQAQNNFGVAQSSFNDLVGRPLATPITLDDVPGVTVGLAPTSTGAVGAPTGNDALFPPPTAEVAGINLDQSLRTAYARRPEILADRVNVRVAETGIKLARAGLEPTLRVDANGFYYPTTDFQSPRQRVVQATATLTIPLYDGNATHDLVQEAHLRRDNAQTTLESQTSDVTLDVQQSYLNLLTAAQQIASANAALQSAIAARQNAEIRYRGGVGLFLEVTDAQAALVQAQNSQINAVYNYEVARAQFENAIGVPQTR